MATILEGTFWEISEAAAERMVENGLLMKCDREHDWVTDGDEPIYHIACNSPSWFGPHSIPEAIASAEAHVEVNDGETTSLPTA